MKMLEVSEAEAASLAEQSAKAGTDALARIMDVLSDCEGRLRDAASKKILIEVTLLKAIEARNAISLDSVLQQLQQLRQGNGATGAPAASPAPAPARARAPETPKPAVNLAVPASPSVTGAAALAETASAPDASGLEELWHRLLEAVGRASPFARTYLMEAHPVSFAKNLFTIGFDPEFEDHIGLVDNARNHTLLQTKLNELGVADAQFKFVKAERLAGTTPRPGPSTDPVAPPVAAAPAARQSASAAPPTPREKPASTPFSKDEFKNDPLIQKALDIFKGQIVEVRS
jgi:DNA polymerase-3 subunit gamma/tau